MDSPTDNRRIPCRQGPYIVGKEDTKISKAHSRRMESATTWLSKLDARHPGNATHPGAYGLVFMRPEIGYPKARLSSRIAGFEATAEFQQFVGALEAYANRDQHPPPETISMETYATATEVLSGNVNGPNTRDALRSFFVRLAKHPAYNLQIPASKLNMQKMSQELISLAANNQYPVRDMWNAVFNSRKPFITSSDDRQLIMKLLNALAKEKMEPSPCLDETGDQEPIMADSIGGEVRIVILTVAHTIKQHR